MSDKRYGLAPGLEVVRLDEDAFLLRSEFAALRLSGEAAADLVDRVVGRLQRPLTHAQIADLMPGYSPDSLRIQLETLVSEGVLVAAERAPDGPASPFAALLDEIGVGARETLDRLANSTVGIFGLEAHGAHVAQLLADAGVGRLVLADPFPFEQPHYSLTPVSDDDAIGGSRERAVARLVGRAGLEVETSGGSEFDRERGAALASRCQLVVACWDRGFSAAHHWANEAAIEQGVPVLFSELRATSSFAGPFFLPGRSACWMCYRMRSLACEDDFDLAMSMEEHLDQKRRPSLGRRPLLPPLPAQLASTLALEALKFLISLNQPRLVDKVLEFDGLLAEWRFHPVLVKPFCPACADREMTRIQPTATELLDVGSCRTTPLHELADDLVSPRTGIVVEFAAASPDATEPSRPLVWRARLSNHCFLSEPEASHMSCSGKGMTRMDAWSSCLGEAVERYSAGCWSPEQTLVRQRRQLEGRSMDPADLVLYRAEQYAELPYSPYRDGTALRWVQGRSLIHGDEVWIPAIAAFMEYHVADQAEFLFPVTSNGLAAGPTLASAVLAAVYEVLERDALLIGWLNQLPARRFDPLTHTDEDVRRLASAYRRRGVELALYQLPTDHPVAVMAGIAFQTNGYGGPFATVGLGANLDPSAAARAAALEVGQVRPAFRQRARTQDAGRIKELVANPAETTTLEDHALLYADPSMASAFDFLNGETADWPEPRSHTSEQALASVLEHFRSVEQDVLYVNLTPPDLQKLDLFTARALIPGFQPIWFGHREPRLGGRRLFDLPHRLGLRRAPTDVGSLNPLPHPIA